MLPIDFFEIRNALIKWANSLPDEYRELYLLYAKSAIRYIVNRKSYDDEAEIVSQYLGYDCSKLFDSMIYRPAIDRYMARNHIVEELKCNCDLYDFNDRLNKGRVNRRLILMEIFYQIDKQLLESGILRCCIKKVSA